MKRIIPLIYMTIDKADIDNDDSSLSRYSDRLKSFIKSQLLQGVFEVIIIAILRILFLSRVRVIRRLILKVELLEKPIISNRITTRHIPTTHWVIYHSYDETATRTCSNIFAVCKLASWNLETVSARTRIMVYAFLIVPCHILDFNLVVIGTHFLECRSFFIRKDPRYVTERNDGG